MNIMMRSRSTRLAQSAAPAEATPYRARSTVSQGPLQAVWIGPALVLARRVRVDEGTFLQGCWLDWDVIRRDLVASVVDLVPHASLEPVPRGRPAGRRGCWPRCRCGWSRARSPSEPEPRWSPVRLSLLIAWACLALAAAAVALLLRGALALERARGTFVSAVTHELRTPLTTFRLYTEMLDEGMVASPDAQRVVLQDAPRRGRPARPPGRERPGLRPARARPRGRPPRGCRAGRAARPPGPPAHPPRPAGRHGASGRSSRFARRSVRVDVSVVDQILSNLVDNAVKYAGDAPDRAHPPGRCAGGPLADSDRA